MIDNRMMSKWKTKKKNQNIIKKVKYNTMKMKKKNIIKKVKYNTIKMKKWNMRMVIWSISKKEKRWKIPPIKNKEIIRDNL